MLVKKWKPSYATIEEAPTENVKSVREEAEDTVIGDDDIAEQKKKKKKKSQQLSTKGTSLDLKEFHLQLTPDH